MTSLLYWNCYRHPAMEPCLDRRRHQPGNIPAESEDLFHQPGTDKRISLIGHHEHSFDIRTKPAIHEGHLQLVLIIRNSANSAEQNLSGVFRRVIHQEPIEGIDLH